MLDRRRVGRTFRRITGAALTALLEGDAEADVAPAPGRGEDRRRRRRRRPRKPTTSAGSADLEDNASDKPAEADDGACGRRHRAVHGGAVRVRRSPASPPDRVQIASGERAAVPI